MKKSKNDPINPPVLVIPYIEKRNMGGYTLRQLTIENGVVVDDFVLHKDIPPIIYGKLVERIKKQGFTGNV